MPKSRNRKKHKKKVRNYRAKSFPPFEVDSEHSLETKTRFSIKKFWKKLGF